MTRSAATKATELLSLHRAPEILTLVNVWDVVSARVVLEAGGRKQTRFAKGGGSYASSPDRRLVFGLGDAETVDKVTVHWPDGTQQEWTGLQADRYHVLTQGEKEPRQPGGKR